MSVYAQPCFWSEAAAHARLEEIVWPNGPVCPHCGACDRIGQVTGKGARAGLRFCCTCRKQFRATMGTMFEGSHVPLTKWFQACFLLTASHGRISAHQLHQRLEVTHKTALRIAHRLKGLLGEAPAAAPTAERRPSAPSAPPASPEPPPPTATLPWITSTPLPRRQYFAFAEAAQGFAFADDARHFDRLLAALAGQPTAPRRRAPANPAWPAVASPGAL